VRRLAVALVLGAAIACGGLPRYEAPEERTVGVPLSQTEHRRSGDLTWRSVALEATADGLLVEFTLMNGTSRDYLSTMLRLVLRGPEHSLATVRYPGGALAAGASRRIRAHLPPPGFAVENVDLELIFAQE
jgi:hypothetical protein